MARFVECCSRHTCVTSVTLAILRFFGRDNDFRLPFCIMGTMISDHESYCYVGH